MTNSTDTDDMDTGGGGGGGGGSLPDPFMGGGPITIHPDQSSISFGDIEIGSRDEYPAYDSENYEIIRTPDNFEFAITEYSSNSFPFCTFYSSLLADNIPVSTESDYTGSLGPNIVTYNSSAVSPSDTIKIDCVVFPNPPDDYDGYFYLEAINEISYSTQPGFSQLLGYINQNGFGWGQPADLLGMGLVSALSVLTALVGFQSRHLPAGVIMFAVMMFVFAWLEMIRLADVFVGVIIFFVIIVVFQRGH